MGARGALTNARATKASRVKGRRRRARTKRTKRTPWRSISPCSASLRTKCTPPQTSPTRTAPAQNPAPRGLFLARRHPRRLLRRQRRDARRTRRWCSRIDRAVLAVATIGSSPTTRPERTFDFRRRERWRRRREKAARRRPGDAASGKKTQRNRRRVCCVAFISRAPCLSWMTWRSRSRLSCTIRGTPPRSSSPPRRCVSCARRLPTSRRSTRRARFGSGETTPARKSR
mmetsp:Transcript_9813/g.41197  ORF Transcript_9813/g.41197 Transcript_9813/m.41197 type:complete len:229 (-) Transcript_9813:1064-1750(-)